MLAQLFAHWANSPAPRCVLIRDAARLITSFILCLSSSYLNLWSFCLPLSTSLKVFSFDFQLTITGVSIFAEKMYMPFFILRFISHRKNFTYFLLFLLEVVLDVYLQPSSCSFVHSFGRVSLWLGLPGFSLRTRLAWVCSSAVGSVSRESVFATICSLCILSGLLCWLSTCLPIISLTNVVCPLTDV